MVQPSRARSPKATVSNPSANSAVSPRGRRTRAALVTAARTIFERDGFLDAKIVDITAEASVATGSFYTHFADKLEIFRALVHEIGDEMDVPVVEIRDAENLEDRIRRSNRAYLAAYRRNARLMALFEEMSLIDDSFRELRITRAKAFSARTADLIGHLQEAGTVRGDLDATLLAESLSAMVSRMAQLTYVWGVPADEEALVETVSHVWFAALGLGQVGRSPEKAPRRTAPKKK